MPVSEDFLDYLVDQLSEWGEVYAKRMFGGAGLFRGGLMFGLVADDIAYLKVDDRNIDKFLEAGSAQFKPYPDKPMVMSFWEIPADILEDRDKLSEWAEESLNIQKDGK